MTAVLIRREVKTQRQRHTGRTTSDNGSRDWRDVSTHQEMPNVASNHQKPRERHGPDPPSEGELILLTTFTLFLWPPEHRQHISVGLSHPSLWYLIRSPRKLTGWGRNWAQIHSTTDCPSWAQLFKSLPLAKYTPSCPTPLQGIKLQVQNLVS